MNSSISPTDPLVKGIAECKFIRAASVAASADLTGGEGAAQQHHDGNGKGSFSCTDERQLFRGVATNDLSVEEFPVEARLTDTCTAATHVNFSPPPQTVVAPNPLQLQKPKRVPETGDPTPACSASTAVSGMSQTTSTDGTGGAVGVEYELDKFEGQVSLEWEVLDNISSVQLQQSCYKTSTNSDAVSGTDATVSAADATLSISTPTTPPSAPQSEGRTMEVMKSTSHAEAPRPTAIVASTTDGAHVATTASLTSAPRLSAAVITASKDVAGSKCAAAVRSSEAAAPFAPPTQPAEQRRSAVVMPMTPRTRRRATWAARARERPGATRAALSALPTKATSPEPMPLPVRCRDLRRCKIY
jgi:hypothetical protein